MIRDTTAITKNQALTIEGVDRRVAPQFPMVGINCPEDLKFTADGWVGVVDYAIELVGEDHVALGSDFDGGPTPPRGMRDIRDLAMITDAMLRRGYSEARIQKFLGGNLLRVFRQITENRHLVACRKNSVPHGHSPYRRGSEARENPNGCRRMGEHARPLQGSGTPIVQTCERASHKRSRGERERRQPSALD